MKPTRRLWLTLLVLLCTFAALAQAPPQFRDAVEEQRFRALTEQLRCVMCQNQSLADSDAMIAKDLRKQILMMMRDDKTDVQIKQFLVDRYTVFVLYKPRLERSTWLLWLGPAALLLLGATIVFTIVRHRSQLLNHSTPPDDGQEW